MIFAVTLILAVGYISASSDPYGSNCYNCEYSLKQSGYGYGGQSGYAQCANPDAPGSGVDVWACKSGRCFTRFDEYSKRVTRGCWSGEVNVNPYAYGCQKQYDGQVWCFCDASSGGYKPCNNHQCDAYGCRDNQYGNQYGSSSGYGKNQYGSSNQYGKNQYGSSNQYGKNQYGSSNQYGKNQYGSSDQYGKNQYGSSGGYGGYQSSGYGSSGGYGGYQSSGYGQGNQYGYPSKSQGYGKRHY
ncbi:stress protein DDR48-like isoform X2 [Lingula anatina]|uniref:Stress protein DDR48-like isoform X2 n=1 Tax=Lingula anatina TaxID=7574 RepID=A0A1S3JCQ4_LINAN|nr:stress protein DDR48-like isoform X2 [Lingula anatina]|eukprot:XP_013408103.1 stress protein DDR48-like isoform X2 [Lingula anatina]